VTAEAGNRSAQVDWLPSASAVTSYQVQVLDSTGTQVGAPRDLLDPPDIAIGLLVEGLTNHQTYTFRVRGVNDFGPGDWSLPSGPVVPHADAPAAPGAPGAVPGNQRVRLTWTAPFDGGSMITGYDVRITSPDGTQRVRSALDTTFNVTGLTNGSTYRFAVRANNEEGPGPWSAEATAVPRSTPGAPHLVGVDSRNRSVRVRWTAPADDGGSPITGYRVLVLTLDGQQVGALRQAGPVASQLLVTGLQNGRSYRFQVQARNELGASPWSSMMRTKPTPG